MSAARAALTVQSNNANALTMSWLMPRWLSFIEPASEERNCLQQNPASHESELAEARGGETRLTSKVIPEQHAGREEASEEKTSVARQASGSCRRNSSPEAADSPQVVLRGNRTHWTSAMRPSAVVQTEVFRRREATRLVICQPSGWQPRERRSPSAPDLQPHCCQWVSEPAR